MQMPCGKFKGKDIEDLPDWYLKWVAENWKEDRAKDRQICEEADREYQWRRKHGVRKS